VLRLHGVQRALNKLRAPGSKDDIPRNVEELQRWKTTLHQFPEPTCIFCGPGNNGGDGLAIARTLFNRGFAVRVLFVGDAATLENAGGDVALNLKLLRGLGMDVEVLADEHAVRDQRASMGGSPLIVDALFGTGLTRTLEDPYRAAVQAI